MKRFIRKISFFLLIFPFFTASAQKEKFSVKFKNGKFISGEKVAAKNFDSRKIESALYKDDYFLLVQFSLIPSKNTEKQLAADGILLHQFISDNAFLAIVHKNFNPGIISKYNITTISAIPSVYKIDRHIIDYKSSGDKEEKKLFAVNYYGSYDQGIVQNELKNNGAIIVKTKFSNAGTIYIQPDTFIVQRLATLPFVTYIGIQSLTDKPLNYTEIGAFGVSGLNALKGRNLNGKGITLGMGDNSDINTHVDFSGRLIDRTSTIPQGHGTHTAGTAAGAGILEVKNHGIAPGATIICQYFSDIIVNAPIYFQDNDMVVSNNSYYSGNDGCNGEGEYDAFANYADEQIYNYDYLLHVIAAGNDGSLTCSPFPAYFGTVKSGWQCAKNVLTVGAIKQQDNSNANFSSRGPVADGRLKPEICAGGWDVYSTTPNNTYDHGSGTSMSAPVVTGVLTLMNERYRQLHSGNKPKSALMKAIACNTAEDIGNPGPDFTYGFGMLNARRAVDAIDSSRYFVNTISGTENRQHTIHIPSGAASVKILLYWADKGAALNASKALVNDLDLTVSDPSSVIHYPLVLNPLPANVNDYATEGVDHLNNIEQVVISNPATGDYTININGFSVPFGPQEYVVTYQVLFPSVVVNYPYGGETWVPGEQENIRWDYAGSDNDPFTIEYSLNNGTSWNLINNNVPSAQRYYNWIVPSVVTDSALIRISKNSTSISGKSDFCFSISARPVLAVSKLCEGSVQLSWNKIQSATNYDVLMLDNDSMKVIASVPDTNYILTGLDKSKNYWFGVRAKLNTAYGRRSISVSVVPDGGSCSYALFNNDLKADSILTPNTARKYFQNDSIASAPVSVRIKNLGTVSVSAPFSVSYTCEGGTATEICSQTITPGGTYTYTFSTPFVPGPSGFHYHFKAWVTYSLDSIHNNDTAYKNVSLLQNAAITNLPLTEGFETAAVATYNNTLGITGDDAIDFTGSTERGRARTFVNTGFARSGNRAMTLDQSPYSDNVNTDSLFLTYNLQPFNNKQLRFDFYYKNHGQDAGNSNKLYIRGSEFNNWIEAYDLYQNQAELGGWARGKININDILTNAQPPQPITNTFQVKFNVEGNTSANSPNPDLDIDDGYTLDDISIQEAINDLAITEIISPDKTVCSLSSANSIAIRVKSYADIRQNNITAHYQVNNGVVFSQNIDSVLPHQVLDFTFDQTADLSAYIDYTIKVWITDTSDTYHSNDTLYYNIHSSPVINSYPYLQRFEINDGFFYTKGKNSSWKWGTPVKTIINKAANGSKAWVTNLTGNYNNNEISYLYSPCFDLTGLAHPVLSFAHIFEIELDYDYTWVEYSTDGVTWMKLGSVGNGTNWYDNSGVNNWLVSNTRWHVASIDIPVTGTVVRFRFVLSSDGGVTKEGVGVDDVHIFDKASVYNDSTSVSLSANVSGSNWIHFVSNGKRIASINSNGQNLGNTTVSVYPNNSYIQNNNGKYYLGRAVVIKPGFQPASDVSVRLYFTNTEANNLLNAPVCPTCALPGNAFELGVTKFSGITENGSLEDNLSGNYQLISPDSTDIIPYDNGYYAETNVKSFSEFWLTKSDIVPIASSYCNGSSVIFTSLTDQSSYQWQVNNGSGFLNITDGSNYSGSVTDTLTILNTPDSLTGTLYRCLVNGIPDNTRTLRFANTWNGAVDINWFNPLNWSCGSVPDQFTDVIIPKDSLKYPVVPSDAAVRSIRLQSNTSVNIDNGIKFQIKGN